MPPAPGTPAPDFQLENQDKKLIRLSDLRGKKVLLAFYPLDFSPVCSNEHACFMHDLPQFTAADAVILGISIDSVWCHKAFREARGITYDLLSDIKREVVQMYDLFLPDANIGKRATVLIDRQGTIAWFKEQPLRQERADAEILAELQKIP